MSWEQNAKSSMDRIVGCEFLLIFCQNTGSVWGRAGTSVISNESLLANIAQIADGKSPSGGMPLVDGLKILPIRKVGTNVNTLKLIAPPDASEEEKARIKQFCVYEFPGSPGTRMLAITKAAKLESAMGPIFELIEHYSGC